MLQQIRPRATLERAGVRSLTRRRRGAPRRRCCAFVALGVARELCAPLPTLVGAAAARRARAAGARAFNFGARTCAAVLHQKLAVRRARRGVRAGAQRRARARARRAYRLVVGRVCGGGLRDAREQRRVLRRRSAAWRGIAARSARTLPTSPTTRCSTRSASESRAPPAAPPPTFRRGGTACSTRRRSRTASPSASRVSRCRAAGSIRRSLSSARPRTFAGAAGRVRRPQRPHAARRARRGARRRRDRAVR